MVRNTFALQCTVYIYLLFVNKSTNWIIEFLVIDSYVLSGSTF